jgi:hypothetical protein
MYDSAAQLKDGMPGGKFVQTGPEGGDSLSYS